MSRLLHELTIHEASNRLARCQISSVELTKAFLNRIDAVEEQIGSYINITRDHALRQAEQADRRLASGDGTMLTGIPIAVKDVICTKGITTTCGSRMLEEFVPSYDAFVIDQLNAAGAVMLGKTNMDEFAMGSSTENSAFRPTANPWDVRCVPGGSSGGSAAAIAAKQALGSLGSDTGGSIRQPAALCGVVGLKPTYGRVSRFGLVAFASSLDQIGPLAHNVRDCAILLEIIAGHDPRDATSASLEVPSYVKTLTPEVAGLHIGVPKEYFVEGMDDSVRRTVEEAIGKLEELGATVDWELSLPNTVYALAAYYIIAPSEASANLARYDGVKYGFSFQEGASMWENLEETRGRGFGPEVKRRIMLGTFALSSGYYDAYYLKAQKVRTLLLREFESAFERYDALVTPASPTPAFRLGERTDNPLAMYLSDVCTIPANIAGLPAISVPCGFVNNLPVGLQVIGKRFDEPTVLHVAHAYEQATNWSDRNPEL